MLEFVDEDFVGQGVGGINVGDGELRRQYRTPRRSKTACESQSSRHLLDVRKMIIPVCSCGVNVRVGRWLLGGIVRGERVEALDHVVDVDQLHHAFAFDLGSPFELIGRFAEEFARGGIVAIHAPAPVGVGA